MTRYTRAKGNAFAVLLVTSAACFSNPAAADLADQFFDPRDGQFDASEYLSENAFGFLPVPVIITEPAVDGGLGLTGLFFHEEEEAAKKRKAAMLESDNAARHLLPPSVSVAFGAYTGNESWLVGGGHMGFFKQGRIRYQGGAGIANINLDYYSIGDVDLGRPISLNTESTAIMQNLKFKLGDLPLYLGPVQRYIDADLSPAKNLADRLPPDTPPELVDQLTDLLSAEVTTSGLGLVLELDTRDNFFTPHTGFYYELNMIAYRDAIGSDIDYDLYQLEGLNYFRLSPSWRGGIRLSGEIADSDELLPPFAMPSLELRGIPAARYQGTYVGLIEGELTWELDQRWSVLGFAGAGRTSDSASNFSDASSRVSKGLGFRYQIARRYGFHMGIDVARGPEDTVWYIQAGSAW